MRQIVICAALALSGIVVACGGGDAPPPRPGASTTAEPTAAGPAPAAADAGGVQGVVTFAADDTDSAIRMDADPQCASFHTEDVYTEEIVADEAGNLANVFVLRQGGRRRGAGAARRDCAARPKRVHLPGPTCRV